MKKTDKYMCEGQMDIFSYMQSIIVPEVAVEDVKLEAGQAVWMVVRGDIDKYEITEEEPWNYTGRLVYRLQQIGGGYWTMPVNEIGNIFFLDSKSAQMKAGEYLTLHTDVILANEIKPVEIKAFSYIRQCDEREMLSFYAILPDGKAYFKNFMEYEHIISYRDIEEARRIVSCNFYRQKEFEYVNPIEKNIVPVFKNMYRCKSGDSWMYAEARYGGCI